MTITPDRKNWTWVLDRVCPECGYEAGSIPREQIPAQLRDCAEQWHRLLTGPSDLRRRPRPDIWSPLEYGCHVRDCCRVYTERLALMLTRDDPAFPDWDQDATAIADAYGEQDPHRVAAELVAVATRLADEFSAVTGGQWERAGARSDGSHFTVESLARYFLHDPVHHLHDVAEHRA